MTASDTPEPDGFMKLTTDDRIDAVRRALGISEFDSKPEHLHALEMRADLAAARARIEQLEGLINTPRVDDFLAAVRTEAAHQIERWGTEHDAGKAPEDWFWLLGYLAGKALHAAKSSDTAKALHHTISSAASLLNWHRAMSGDDNRMRPGIDSAALAQPLAVAPEAESGPHYSPESEGR